jgi:uncharacterized protein (TIGR02266 family)
LLNLAGFASDVPISITTGREVSAMDEKYFIDSHGTMDELGEGDNHRRHVRFPVHLAVKYQDSSLNDYEDFVLNAGRGGVFIETGRPLPEGSRLTMHFYIPPQVKLLGSVQGTVVWSNTSGLKHPRGMGIRFDSGCEGEMQKLVELMEEHKHLIDCSG